MRAGVYGFMITGSGSSLIPPSPTKSRSAHMCRLQVGCTRVGSCCFRFRVQASMNLWLVVSGMLCLMLVAKPRLMIGVYWDLHDDQSVKAVGDACTFPNK